MNMKKVIKFLLVIIWMLLIYYFSSQNGTISSNMSGGIVDSFIAFLEELGIMFSDGFINIFGFLIRKLAHFTLYFILGLLWMSFLKEYSLSFRMKIVYTILLCLLYACSDEIHQLFVSGRDGKILDVLIDTFGSLFSILFSYTMVWCN